MAKCLACDGTGVLQSGDVEWICKDCGGEGEIPEHVPHESHE